MEVKLHEFPEEIERLIPIKVSKGDSSGNSTLPKLESRFSTFSSLRKILTRKRNLLNLLSSYPLRLTYDCVYYSTGVPYDERAIRYLAGLMPIEMIMEAKKGYRTCSIFSEAASDLVPEAILNLASDLAVHQLMKILLSIPKNQQHHINYIRLSTRSDSEKRAVAAKIEAALKEKLDILNSFRKTLSIDASMYSTTEAENQCRQHICQLLELPVIKDNDILCTKRIEEEMSGNRYLVLLVDRDGDAVIDLCKVGFSKTKLSGVMVLITTESATQAKEELITKLDFEIWTRAHLLPWQVFCSNVGGQEVVYSSSATLAIAVHIVEECRDQLLAIALVAKWLLRNSQDVKHWELAVDKMFYANPSCDSIHGGLSRVMVNTFMNFVWDGMDNILKSCLVRCLFIPDIRSAKVDYELVNDWMSSLFMDAEEAGNNLRQLVDCCVLLRVKAFGKRINMCVRLPEEIYEIVEKLQNLYPMLIKKAGEVIEVATIERWHSAIHIELVDSKMSELPFSPIWQDLTVLVIQGNADLTEIPPSFFDHMCMLRILDLSYTSVRELPSSLFNLVQLRELYLKGCECLMKLPPEIGKLLKLEKLDLEGTQIIHLPKEFQQLTNMQSLILYFYEYRGRKNKSYSKSTIIPSGVISKLKGLKHLSIDVNPNDERWHENVRVILPEIFGLECLQTLSIYIPHLELLKLIPAYIFEVDFRFIVGCHMQRIISSIPPAIDVKFKQSDCSLKFVKGEGVPTEIKMLLRHSKALFLDRHFTVKNLSEFEMKNFEQLRVCILAECKEMQTIVGARHLNGNDDMFSHLLFLSVSHMKNLRSIWEGPTPPRSLFGMLQYLSLQSCPKLMILFSLDFLGNLSLLKELIVKDCPKLSTLISHESSKYNKYNFLPSLRKLSLLHLPELTSISSGLPIGPGLEEMAIYDCPKLCSLSRNELLSKELVAIKGETNWWKALKHRPSKFDQIFSPIHEEADVVTQFGIYNDDNIDNNPGSSVGKLLQPTSVANPTLNSPAWSGQATMVKAQRWWCPSHQLFIPYHNVDIQQVPIQLAVESPDSACSQVSPALKLQKVYRGHRTRRQLADSAIIAEELWRQAKELKRLNNIAISFFDLPESAPSQSSPVNLIASKVGKGLSLDTKVQMLAFQHWIEAIDPRHRYGRNLHYYYEVWCKMDAGQPFFYWLDIGDGKELDLEQCPRSKLQKQCIKYLEPQEREHYEYIVCHGKIIHKQSRDFLDTHKDSENAKWIFVVSTYKKLYAGKKKKGLFHHSSFLAGGATVAAGRLEAENGILKSISIYSGYYRPTDDNLNSFLSYLKENGVKLDEVEIRKLNDDSEILYGDGKLIERDTKYEASSTTDVSSELGISQEAVSSELGISQEAENTASSDEEDPQPATVGRYKSTVLGGIQVPRLKLPKKAIFQRIESKKVTNPTNWGINSQ